MRPRAGPGAYPNILTRQIHCTVQPMSPIVNRGKYPRTAMAPWPSGQPGRIATRHDQGPPRDPQHRSIARAMRPVRPARLIAAGPEKGARQPGRAGAALAEARTCIVLPVHREEVRALDRGVAADHRGLWPREAHGHRGVPEVRAWHGARACQRTRRLDARRQRRQSLKLRGSLPSPQVSEINRRCDEFPA
jgi:hypothetical protein